ncbi:MAG: hypothetical protein J6R82_06155 [Clostridia bacterium]|nr:hypothetical protein [Clostridia bacterium]
MLRKLIAYDFQSTAKQYAMILGLSSLAAIVGTIAMAFEDKLRVLNALTTFCMLGAFVAPMAIWILVAIHYHKKFFSDEAYLTFTLPATPGQHLASKLISGSIWYFAAIGVIVFNVVLMIVVDTIINPIEPLPPATDGGTISDTESAVVSWLLISLLSWLICAVVAIISQIALMYLSLTISGSIATKHKGIMGVLVYMALDSIVGTIIGIVEAILMISLIFTVEEQAFAVLGIISTVIYAALFALCVWITHYLLSRKLNIQ